ncbi:hypothetical protein [Laspinema olomoucense]|uniref:hypothetical protein n=1 Tax=Laspinema olomoucense TaxID=3231600 RepID=UPI0021BB7137|nr:hypothetical protein [Laspinema sp. D3a]MCT7988828.1 hypothetical protein [Laspinema sp. D3a]
MSYDNDAYWVAHAQIDNEISDEDYLSGLRLPDMVFSSDDPQDTFRVTVFSVRAKPTWWLGGTLNRCIGAIEQELDFVSGSQVIPLNEITLVRIGPASQETYFKFKPPFWFLQCTLLVERYEVPPRE